MPLRMASEAMDLIHEAASRVGEGKDVRATLVEGEPIVPEGSGRGQGL
jgi:hypothetical protein